MMRLEIFSSSIMPTATPTILLVNIEMQELKQALQIDRDIIQNISYMSFWKTKGNRLRLLILVVVGFLSQWSGNGLISVNLL